MLLVPEGHIQRPHHHMRQNQAKVHQLQHVQWHCLWLTWFCWTLKHLSMMFQAKDSRDNAKDAAPLSSINKLGRALFLCSVS